jgi:hypothetical protein
MNPIPPQSRSAPRTLPVLLALLAILAACSGGALPAPPAPTAPPPGALAPEQEAFWTRLAALCGGAFEGRVRMAPEGDDWWDADRVVMHVRECGESEVRIPLHIDQNRSRTWVVTRTAEGLRLKHDHRLPSGEPDTANTQYGGDTVGPGTVWRQEFPADTYSVGVVPARASQLWYLELRPDRDFAYGLRREATGMRYHLEFDLTRPVEPPPAPWGAGQRTAQQ